MSTAVRLRVPDCHKGQLTNRIGGIQRTSSITMQLAIQVKSSLPYVRARGG